MPSETISSLDETDIESLFSYLNYITRDTRKDVPKWFEKHLKEMQRKEERL